MRIDLDNLPDDPALLRQMLRQVVQEMGAEIDKLRLLIQRLVRHQCAGRSPRLRCIGVPWRFGSSMSSAGLAHAAAACCM